MRLSGAHTAPDSARLTLLMRTLRDGTSPDGLHTHNNNNIGMGGWDKCACSVLSRSRRTRPLL
eukprot:6533393-Prymnesium_polylepis.1